MKAIAWLALSAGFAFPAAVLAQHDHHQHAMPAAQNQTQASLWADGTVKKVDKAAAKLTLAHGPLENLGMPPMTMAFRVKDTAWLSQMKEGDRIRFVADYLNGAVTVVRYEPVR